MTSSQSSLTDAMPLAMTDCPTIEYIDSAEPLEKINAIIARDGAVIVKQFLAADLIKETMSAIEPHFAQRTIYRSNATHKELGTDFFPEGSIRIYGLLSRIPRQLTEILRNPIWHGVMAHFLNEESFSYVGKTLLAQKSGYILSTTGALRLVPGAGAQPLHRDQISFMTRYDPSNPMYTPKVGVLIAGSRCTKKNGATAVIPGSHLWSPDRVPDISEATYAEMESGDALFTLGSTYHAGGANTCDVGDQDPVRTLFSAFGQRDYYRQDQMENFSTPLEIARRLPEDILKLTGYYKAMGGVGYVEDHLNPADYLHSKTGMGLFPPIGSEVE